MRGRRLPDNVMPTEPGDFARFTEQPRPWEARGDAPEDEWFVRAPNDELFSLIPEVHVVVEHADGTISASPSVLSPSHAYHGMLLHGMWS